MSLASGKGRNQGVGEKVRTEVSINPFQPEKYLNSERNG